MSFNTSSDSLRPNKRQQFVCHFYRPSGKPEIKFSREALRELYEETHSVFKEIEDFSSEKGLTKTALIRSMQFFSLAINHDIARCRQNGHSVAFYCANADPPFKKTENVCMMEKKVL